MVKYLIKLGTDVARCDVGAFYVMEAKALNVKDLEGRACDVKRNKKGGASIAIKKHGGWTAAFDLAKKVAKWY